VVSLVVSQVCLTKLLVDGESDLDIIFSRTLENMGYDMTTLLSTNQAFYDIIPSAESTSVGRVTLSVTFGTRDNYSPEYINFEVASFSHLLASRIKSASARNRGSFHPRVFQGIVSTGNVSILSKA